MVVVADAFDPVVIDGHEHRKPCHPDRDCGLDQVPHN
jgi:hypothetical protein